MYITAFSYFLKKQFCDMNKLDIGRFMSDHSYKNAFRDELTAYLDTCEYTTFTKLLINAINENEFGIHDIYIIDDVRCLQSQIEYLNEHCKTWNVFTIRINSSDDQKKSRGWIRTDYDDHMCENDLDNYTLFDVTIDNNGSINDLKKLILMSI